ncbi:Hermansky-Pudlak syndrome 5 protein homolog isoform X2 [Nematostella vectensis]|uniref:Hermansky-Pudlak syndrome 5 protein homolog isoform X2 n=1 Tax=Nematostella vectensis TaxID=45351 RepID=UPI0020776D22|nr:Hermansky-Pudlak syndrome 5 protein homolog isoform X2 [Nematostella vectensis]
MVDGASNEECRGLDWVLGEYGFFLVEMGSLYDISNFAKTSSRIKYTCMSVGQKLIAIGSSSGAVYIYNRRTLRHLRVIMTKDGAVSNLCFQSCKNVLGIAKSSGMVFIWDIGTRTRDKPKCLRRSDQHKGAVVTCLCWDDDGVRLFAGDDQGFVSVLRMPFLSKIGGSPGTKKLTIGHNTDIIGKSETAINQLDCAGDRILISTMRKTAILDIPSNSCWPVGSKAREGKFGACYFRQNGQQGVTIYTARPSSRLWEASMDGQVLSTQQYKQLLATPPTPIISELSDIDDLSCQPANKFSPQSVNFPYLYLVRERFLLTWYGNRLILLDPILGQLVGWYQLDRDVSHISCSGSQFYVYHVDGYMSWFGVLNVKECVARLYELNAVTQCAKVALLCKHYLVPGAARDLVPTSMMTSLRDKLLELPGHQELVSSLEELLRQVEESSTLTDKPPGFYGNEEIGTPDTMSVCSDSQLWGEGEGSVRSEPQGRGLRRSDDFSLDNALFAVAAKAKKFAEERRKNSRLKFPMLRRASDEGSVTPTDRGTSEQGNELRLDPGSASGSEAMCEVDSALHSPSEAPAFHSDDSGSRHEDDVFESVPRKGKISAKEKKKRKRKVVTVDIDSPSGKYFEGTKPPGQQIYGSRAQSARDAQVQLHRSRASPEPLPHGNTAPPELAPAFPSMLSKAKNLFQRRLNAGETGAESVRLARSQSLPLEYDVEDGECEEDGEETGEEPRLKAADDLERATKETRDRVGDLSIFCSRSALRQVLQNWISFLHSAVTACARHQSLDLLSVLAENSAQDDVRMLVKMCFDTGVYGPETNPGVETESEVMTSDDGDKVSTTTGSRDLNVVLPLAETEEKVSGARKSEGLHSGVKGIESRPKEEENGREVHMSGDSSLERLRSKEEVNGQIHMSGDISPELEDIEGGAISLTNAQPAVLSGVTKCESRTVPSATASNHSWICEACSKKSPFNSESVLGASLSRLASKRERDAELDGRRARFVSRYFNMMGVDKIRRTLNLTRGLKSKTWRALLRPINDTYESSAVSDHLRNGDVTRALHVLHEEMDEFRDVILHYLNAAFMLQGRDTVMTCVKMYPDVRPWEVMEMCRSGGDLKTSAQSFVFYMEQLLRWRQETGEARSQTLRALCREEEVLQAWCHSALIASEPLDQRHSECGVPRSFAHTLFWKHDNQLKSVLDIVCQRSSLDEVAPYIDMCWKHGYWRGFVRLCVAAGFRELALLVVVYLRDIKLLDISHPWGALPKTLGEWRALLRMLASVQQSSDLPEDERCACEYEDRSRDSSVICWENVVPLALSRLGTSHTVQLLKDVPYRGKALPKDFYYKCIMGAAIETEQRKLVHEMLCNLDAYLWSQRAGAMTPELNYLRTKETSDAPQETADPSPVAPHPISSVRTLEDAATSWGTNIHLAEAHCPVCKLPLCDQVSSSNQGILVFECSHVFHRFCVPECACVVCFHQNLRSLAGDK